MSVDSVPDPKAMNPLPMRGAILSAVISAFRLGEKCRDDSSAKVSPGTAKRILQDGHAVMRPTRVALTRVFIDHLFTQDYLHARELDDAEARIHNEMLASALDAVLDTWEAMVRVSNNHVGVLPIPARHFVLGSGIVPDVAVRFAAYLCLYPRLHSFPDPNVWLANPGLKGVYDALIARALIKPSLERLCQNAQLKKNTIKAIRNGSTDTPQGYTLEKLARALEKHHVSRLYRSGLSTSAEIEVELRFGAAVAQARSALQENQSYTEFVRLAEIIVKHLRFELRRHTRDELCALLLRGRSAPLWPTIEQWIRIHAMEEAGHAAAMMHAEAQRDMDLMKKDPAAAMRKMAESSEADARHLKENMAGVDELFVEPMAPMIGFFEHLAAFMRFLADHWTEIEQGTCNESPPKAPYELAQLESMGKWLDGMAPWNQSDAAECENSLREAVAVDSTNAHARLDLACRLAKTGRFDEAIAHAHAILGERPDHHDARHWLGLWLLRAGRAQEALFEAQELKRLGADPIEASVLRAWCLVELGRLAEAEPAFEAAIKANCRLAAALEGMARCRRATGDERGARDYERRAAYYGGTGSL